MNTLESTNIQINGKYTDCAKFTIDTPADPFLINEVMVSGENYVYSFYIKSDTTSSIIINVGDEEYTVNTTTAFSKNIIKFIATGEDIKVYFSSGIFYIGYSMLELGNVASDWSPNPDDIEAQISITTTTIKQVEFAVNQNTKSIESKVWQDDITESINNYDNTTTSELRTRITQAETDIDGIHESIKDVQTTVSEKADGSTVQTLSEKITDVEKTAEGVKTTVTENYVTKDAVGADFSSEKTVMEQVSDQITLAVENATGDGSYLQMQDEEIKAVVGKDAFNVVKMRYIRDWLYSNDMDTENRFVECRVILEDGDNLAVGKTVTAYNSNGEQVTIDESILATYVDDTGYQQTPQTDSDGNTLTDEEGNALYNDVEYIYDENVSMLQIDLGDIYDNVDKLEVYHYFTDKRTNRMKVEISEDGKTWIEVYSTDANGSYVESSFGLDLQIQVEPLYEQMSYLKMQVDSLALGVQKNDEQYAELSVKFDEFNTTITNQVDGLQSQVEQTDEQWKVTLTNTGIYVDDEHTIPASTTARFTPTGWSVTSTESAGNTTVMDADSFTGYYNDGITEYENDYGERVFELSKDEVYTKKLTAAEGCDFTNVKIIPVTSGTHKGIAFVSAM